MYLHQCNHLSVLREGERGNDRDGEGHRKLERVGSERRRSRRERERERVRESERDIYNLHDIFMYVFIPPLTLKRHNL